MVFFSCKNKLEQTGIELSEALSSKEQLRSEIKQLQQENEKLRRQLASGRQSTHIRRTSRDVSSII